MLVSGNVLVNSSIYSSSFGYVCGRNSSYGLVTVFSSNMKNTSIDKSIISFSDDFQDNYIDYA